MVLALATAWLTAVLEFFPYTRPWGEDLNGNLLHLVKQVALVIAAIPGLVLIVVIYFIARGVVRVGKIFFDRAAAGRSDIGWLDAVCVCVWSDIVVLS